MKILVNTKGFLVHLLNHFNLDEVIITSAVIEDTTVTLRASNRMHSMHITRLSVAKQEHVIQNKARWDWVKKALQQLDDQPIILILTENHVELRIQY